MQGSTGRWLCLHLVWGLQWGNHGGLWTWFAAPSSALCVIYTCHVPCDVYSKYGPLRVMLRDTFQQIVWSLEILVNVIDYHATYLWKGLHILVPCTAALIAIDHNLTIMHWPYVLLNPSAALMANNPYNIVFNWPNGNAPRMLAALMAISHTSPYYILMIILISIWLFNMAKLTTVGQLVITPTYTVSHPISPTTSLLANWSLLYHTPLAASSAPPPHCWPTGHQSNIHCWLPN